MNTAYQRLLRYQKFLALSNAVLLSNRSAEASQQHLEQMIAERVEKEFVDPTTEEAEIIAGIKEHNLHFVERNIKQQNDGEIFTQIKHNVREKDVHIFAKFKDKNLDLQEVLILGDTLKRAGAKSATLYLPYIPYLRQDKKDEGRVPITARVVFDQLVASYGPLLKRIVTFDMHAAQIEGYFNGPLDHIPCAPEFAAYYRHLFRQELATDPQQVMVFSPDAGGAKRARNLAKLLGVSYQVLDKKRLGHGQADTEKPEVDVRERKIIFVDDIIDSSSSLVGEYEHMKEGPIQFLQSRGAQVYACATHAVFSAKNGISAEERLQQAHLPILITDSLPEKQPGYYEANESWMNVLSLDYALAKAFYCNQVGESISAFLGQREERLQAKDINFVVRRDKGRIVVE